MTNKTLRSIRMVRGEIFQSANSGQSQDRVVLKEERRTTPRYLSFQGRFHKLRVGGVSCQGVAATHLFTISCECELVVDIYSLLISSRI